MATPITNLPLTVPDGTELVAMQSGDGLTAQSVTTAALLGVSNNRYTVSQLGSVFVASGSAGELYRGSDLAAAINTSLTAANASGSAAAVTIDASGELDAPCTFYSDISIIVNGTLTAAVGSSVPGGAGGVFTAAAGGQSNVLFGGNGALIGRQDEVQVHSAISARSITNFTLVGLSISFIAGINIVQAHHAVYLSQCAGVYIAGCDISEVTDDCIAILGSTNVRINGCNLSVGPSIATTSAAVEIEGDVGAETTYVTISNCNIQTPYLKTDNDINGILLDSNATQAKCSFIAINNCTFKEIPSGSIKLKTDSANAFQNSNIAISTCVFDNSGTIGSIAMDNVSDVTVSSVSMTGPGQGSATSAIDLRGGCKDIVISDLVAQGFLGNGIRIDTCTYWTLSNCNIYDCGVSTVFNGDNAVYITGPGDFDHHGRVIGGCAKDSNGTPNMRGIKFRNSFGALITGFEFDQSIKNPTNGVVWEGSPAVEQVEDQITDCRGLTYAPNV